MNKTESDFLLKLARNVIFRKSKDVKINIDLSKTLLEEKGTFVTLYKEEQLRGCIGNILPNSPLYISVINNSFSSAFNDFRFSPVNKDELDSINIEISILSVPVKINYKNIDDLLNQITPKEDGIIISNGFNSATFLPQVWDQIIDKDLFLSNLCNKAGMDFFEWQKCELDIKKYTVEKFSDFPS